MKMARNRALLLPILQKVSTALTTKIRRKPIILKLSFLKKSSRKLKRFQLFNNGFLRDYQLSPLIHKTQLQNRGGRRGRARRRTVGEAYSALFLCRCLGGIRRGKGDERSDRVVQSLPGTVEGGVSSGECLEPLDYFDEDEDNDDDGSIDERAEKFIEWFYEEMRLQRQESI
ncbi:uncharacterized protein LOC110813347 [Carica papaya]|uniref:uncharacterized protein LOC110813347 n=1 Tax=Carica papaya TaxID=3649 RepID=UPI000B8CC52E|nr:uncharacterized protein LOC110813347 [Carica papaya]